MNATFERLEPRLLLSSDPLTWPTIIDDDHAGFTTSGSWSQVDGAGFEDDYLQASNDSAVATWTFSDLNPGYLYRLSAAWVADASNTTEAHYTVISTLDLDNQWTLAKASIDQSADPGDFTFAGILWEDLGGPFLIRGTTLSVTLDAPSGDRLVADAIRIERVGKWVAPIGIPSPDFGIDETHWMYAEAGSSSKYKIGSDGPYTHYVDNTHPGATDAGNPYGSPDMPRLTIPSYVSAGSVIEVHGGGYESPRGIEIEANGTAAKPVFLRGPRSQPTVLNTELQIEGQYLIIENFEVVGHQIDARDDRPNHIAVRNVDVHDFNPVGDKNAISIAGTDIVIYNCRIYNNGDSEADFEQDIHGTKARGENIWVVDSHIYRNGGDGVQVNGKNNNADDAQYIYIGRNVIHGDRENAIDIKAGRHVVISQNIMYDYDPTDGEGSDGTAVVGAHEGSDIAWYLFNEIFDSSRGIRINESELSAREYIIGNIIHDVSGAAIYTRFDSTVYVVNNVIYDVGRGFDGSSGLADYHIFNNIFANMSYHIYVDSPDNTEVYNNLHYENNGTPRFYWDGDTYSGLDDFQDTGEGENSLVARPDFVDWSADDVRLMVDSPAIDAGASLQSLMALFRGYYDADIGADYAGDDRQQGGQVDIGAFETPVVSDDHQTPPDVDLPISDGPYTTEDTITLVLGKGQAKSISFKNAQNALVTVKMGGDGLGQVTLRGGNIVPIIKKGKITCVGENIEVAKVNLVGSTMKTKLSFRAKGKGVLIPVGGVVGGDLGSLNGKQVVLVGTTNLINLKKLAVNKIEGASVDITGYLGSMKVMSISDSGMFIASDGGKWRIKEDIKNSDISIDGALKGLGVYAIRNSQIYLSAAAGKWKVKEDIDQSQITIDGVLQGLSAFAIRDTQIVLNADAGKWKVKNEILRVNLDAEGVLAGLSALKIQESQLTVASAGKSWKVKEGVIDCDVTVENGAFNIKIGGSVIGSSFDFDSVIKFDVGGDFEAMQLGENVWRQSILQGASAEKITIKGSFNGSIIAIGVDPGDGGYFDGDESGTGGMMTSLRIGQYQTDGGAGLSGIVVDAIGKLRLADMDLLPADLPYVDGAFSVVSV